MNSPDTEEFLRHSEVVNISDMEYTDGKAFFLVMGSYGEHKFVVFARHYQEALEILGQYFRYNGYTGFICEDRDDDSEYFDDSYFGVNGGEFYIRLPDLVWEKWLRKEDL